MILILGLVRPLQQVEMLFSAEPAFQILCKEGEERIRQQEPFAHPAICREPLVKLQLKLSVAGQKEEERKFQRDRCA